ncbi:MAG: transporter substrate-binding domain-containing protein [Chloroflexota bacterium]|jgi:polar amino acid transport system substrate-binding protein|nr:transporter substrate-binding domain-containing protein [Chloroflexota bacterium]MDH5243141.1 transporter substrate-binding domain-containing protein [Chloroflexota bacterium]
MRQATLGVARFTGLIVIAALIGGVLAACSGDGASDDLLAKVKAANKIVMSTDPEYPPQSALAPDGTYEGFDIDVGTEIAKRLGVDISFETPSWEAITAGSWSGRWDFSVGSMTITTDREKVIAFTEPYYYTPAQMSVEATSDIGSVADLTGQAVCVGAATTYQQWLDGTLDFGTKTPDAAPADITVVSLNTDRNCAEAWQAGRQDFQGWLSSSTTVQGAIDAGLPVKAIGDPVFAEPLAVAFDKSGPDPTSMVTEVNKILDEMRSDGTLGSLSMKWFEEDLTNPAGG